MNSYHRFEPFYKKNKTRLFPYLLGIIFVILGVYYSICTPIWEAPDETGHFGNVWYIATHKTLPGPGTFYTWHQAPLYHIIAAIAISGIEMRPTGDWYRSNPNSPTVTFSDEPNISLHSIRELFPYRDIPLAFHIARWINVLFGAVTVFVTYLLSRRIFPSQPWIAVGAAGLVAFNPQFIFMSAAVQNDVPLSAAFALMMLPAVAIVQGDHRRRQFVWLGFLAGLAVLFKQSGIVLIGVAGLVVLWAGWQSRRWKDLLTWGGFTLLAWGVTTAPMYLRNMFLYGDPFAYKIYKSLHPPVEPKQLGDITLKWITHILVVLHNSFWGKFGWLTLSMPNVIYAALYGIYVLAGVGLLIWLVWGRKKYAAPVGGIPVILLLLAGMAAAWTFTFKYIMEFGAFGMQGRYLFQMISAQSILLSLGIFSLLPPRWSRWMVAVALAALLALAIWVPGAIIRPAFKYLGDSPEILQTAQFHRADQFGNAIELAGYSVSPLSDGQSRVTLYWRVLATPAGDYTIFVHLLDETGTRHSQSDRRPLDGGFPTQLWRPGDIFHTEYDLTIPAQCSQIKCYWAVGLYNWETGERLAVTQGVAPDNAVSLTEFFSQ